MANDSSEKKPQSAGEDGESKPASPEQPKLDALEPEKPAAPEAPKPVAPTPVGPEMPAAAPVPSVPATPAPVPAVQPVPASPVAPKPAAAGPPIAKAAVPGAPAAKPAAPAAKKEEPPKPVPLESELVSRFKGKFGSAMREAWLDRKQGILVVERENLEAICQYARDAEKFDYLVDLTAVDWPKREKRFDVILFLYSFKKNERLRLKAHTGDGETVPSVCKIWGAANWLEREVFDMFGIKFDGHPDLKRILLPDGWKGHQLRKDYSILQQDNEWVQINLGIESGQ